LTARDELKAKVEQLKESKSTDIDLEPLVEELSRAEKLLQQLREKTS